MTREKEKETMKQMSRTDVVWLDWGEIENAPEGQCLGIQQRDQDRFATFFFVESSKS